MHRYRRKEIVEDGDAGGVGVSQGLVECIECDRTFSRQGDLKRHKCLMTRANHPRTARFSPMSDLRDVV